MSSPVLHAFFMGRALADAVNERAESGVAYSGAPGASGEGGTVTDLQATIDTLRAEIAQVRVALQQYRSTSQS